MDIVYVYKEGKDCGESMRLSLESVAMNCHYVDRVFILCPELTAIEVMRDVETADYVVHIGGAKECDVEMLCPVIVVRHEDSYKRKHKNILDALMYLVKNLDVGCNDDGVFMYSSDDHWYVDEFDCRFGYSPVWIKGVLHTQHDINLAESDGGKANNWLRSMVETRNVLGEAGYSYFDFSQHANTWFNSRMMRERGFEELVKRAQSGMYGCEPSCLMMNYWVTRRASDVGNRFLLRHRRDFKIGADWSVERVKSELRALRVEAGDKRECISGSDGVVMDEKLRTLIWELIIEN